jgi:hypothetical protein
MPQAVAEPASHARSAKSAMACEVALIFPAADGFFRGRKENFDAARWRGEMQGNDLNSEPRNPGKCCEPELRRAFVLLELRRFRFFVCCEPDWGERTKSGRKGRSGAGSVGAGRRAGRSAGRSAGPWRAATLARRGGDLDGGGMMFSRHFLHFIMCVKRAMVWTLTTEAKEPRGKCDRKSPRKRVFKG